MSLAIGEGLVSSGVPALRQLLCIGIFLAAALLAPATVLAHEAGLSRGHYTLGETTIEAEISVALRDARAIARQLDRNRDGTLDHAEVRAGSDELTRRLTAGIVWHEGEHLCPPSAPRLTPAGDDGLTLAVQFTCPKRLSPDLRVDVRELLTGADAGHRHILEVVGPTGDVGRFAGHRASFVIAPWVAANKEPDGARGHSTPHLETLARDTLYLHVGFQHVLGGWDHLLFICGLVLVFFAGETRDRSRGRLVGWVSGFTLGHCLSLMLATLVGWQADPDWVEPLIALSLAHLGWVALGRSRTGWSLLGVLIGFGLIHGLGFAGALAVMGVAGMSGLGPLFLFNIGVEAGQLAILAGMVATCHLLFRAWPQAQRATITAAAWGLLVLGLGAAVVRLLSG